jgi:hypothetical protein
MEHKYKSIKNRGLFVLLTTLDISLSGYSLFFNLNRLNDIGLHITANSAPNIALLPVIYINERELDIIFKFVTMLAQTNENFFPKITGNVYILFALSPS